MRSWCESAELQRTVITIWSGSNRSSGVLCEWRNVRKGWEWAAARTARVCPTPAASAMSSFGPGAPVDMLQDTDAGQSLASMHVASARSAFARHVEVSEREPRDPFEHAAGQTCCQEIGPKQACEDQQGGAFKGTSLSTMRTKGHSEYPTLGAAWLGIIIISNRHWARR